MPGLMASKNVIHLQMKKMLERRQKLDQRKKRLIAILKEVDDKEDHHLLSLDQELNLLREELDARRDALKH